MAYLPDDILYMICTQLWHQRDFNTLFNCACSGKQLATMALMNLYRMHEEAPVTNGGSDEEIPVHNRLGKMNHATRLPQKELIYMKWAGLWRTIILSSLGKTLYPYSQFIRTLNLRDLEELLTDSKLRARTSKYQKDFFHGELAQFKVETVHSNGGGGHGPRLLNSVETINKIGEAVTMETPLLEALIGRVHNGALSRWIPRLPRLTHLKPWYGSAVEGNGNLIRLHCPLFKRLDFWDWDGSNCDEGLANFLNELRPHSLESLETFSNHGFGPESFQALSCHGESLIGLKLNVLWPENIPKLPLLKGCINLVYLSLAGNWQTIDLEQTHNDSFLETVAWLKECKKLRILALTKIFSAPALITPMLLENGIHLTSLEYEGTVVRDAKKFYQAMANQTSLQSLWLKGDVDDLALEPDVLVESLSNLVNLTDLRLREVSDSFVDQHIVQLAKSLPKLEVWSTSGYGLTDAIWSDVASLSWLRRLELGALTSFTLDGILGFIDKLGDGNKGLNLSVMNADVDSALSAKEQDLIQDRIAKKAEGKFEFTMSRDPEMSSFEGESD